MRKEVVGNLFAKACPRLGSENQRTACARRQPLTRPIVEPCGPARGHFWMGRGHMASLYTRSADREALAMGAIAKLSREAFRERVYSAPDGETPAPKKITKKIK